MDSVGGDTLARMFWRRVEGRGSLDAHLVRRQGTWHRLTWADVGATVRDVACGLLALGRLPQEPVALLSASRAEWVQADFAILSIGGVTVPIYPTSTADQIASVVNDSGARTMLVEEPGQLVRLREIRTRMPKLEHIVVIEGTTGREGLVLAWDELRRLGRVEANRLEEILAARIGSARPED